MAERSPRSENQIQGVGAGALGAVAAVAALDDAGHAARDLDLVLVGKIGAEMAKGQNVMDPLLRSGHSVLR